MHLVTQINLYSKNFLQTPIILWFYCIELFTRIPEQLDLLFYEFSTNLYWISKFTARNYKEVLKALFIWVKVYSNNPLDFLEFQPEVPGRQTRTEQGRRRRFRGVGSPAVGGPRGKRERGSRATSGGSWGSRTRTEGAARWSRAAGGELARRRWCSSGRGRWGASRRARNIYFCYMGSCGNPA